MPTVSSLQQASNMATSQQLVIKSVLSISKTKTCFSGDNSRLGFATPNPFAKTIRASTGLNLSPVCKCSMISKAPIDAIFFDIDGTMIDSDPIHFRAFEHLLVEAGYNGGIPITEDFYVKEVCGKHNDLLGPFLFPDWDVRKSREFLANKENLFKKMAVKELKMVAGLDRMFTYIKDRGLKHAAVTNAPRPSAEFLLTRTGLGDKFETVVIGIEWGRPKPFPDPYLKALELLRISNKRAMVFEDSCAGIKAGVAAGLPVIGVALRNPPELLEEAGAVMTIRDYNDPKLWKALGELEKIADEAKVAVGV